MPVTSSSEAKLLSRQELAADDSDLAAESDCAQSETSAFQRASGPFGPRSASSASKLPFSRPSVDSAATSVGSVTSTSIPIAPPLASTRSPPALPARSSPAADQLLMVVAKSSAIMSRAARWSTVDPATRTRPARLPDVAGSGDVVPSLVI